MRKGCQDFRAKTRTKAPVQQQWTNLAESIRKRHINAFEMMSQNSIAPSGVYTSRRMRKGTRSCSDCRKRKVRCIFLKDAKTCELCVTKGRRCVEQNRDVVQEAALETKEILRERIARLEATIQALQSQDSVAGPPEGLLEGLIIAAGTAGNSSALRPLPSPKTSALSSYINSKATQKIDTLGALFDNAIVSLQGNKNASISTN